MQRWGGQSLPGFQNLGFRAMLDWGERERSNDASQVSFPVVSANVRRGSGT